MHNTIFILLKISISLAFLFGVYFFILRKETTFRFIRFFLLFSVIISVAFPFIPFKINWTPPVLVSNQFSKLKPVSPNELNFAESDNTPIGATNQPLIDTTNKTSWFIYFYIVGLALFSIRFIFNLISVILKIHRKKIVKKEGFVFVDTSPGKSIHSFFHFIFLPKEQLNKPSNSILEHEKTHARQLHSIDVLVIEILQVLLWFHPMVYIFKNSIVLNHEYLADENAVKSGKADYQQSLLAWCIECNQLQFTSGFNFNHIKKRIAMMTKQSKKQNILLKPLSAFIFAGLLFAGLSLKEKPAEAMTTEFEIPAISLSSPMSDHDISDNNSGLITEISQDPKNKEKEIQLKKLMLKRDSIMKTMQLKMEKAQKLAQFKHQEKMENMKKLLQKDMFKAQQQMELKQKEMQLKMKKMQLESEGKEITPELEYKMQQMENELNNELKNLEKEINLNLELKEDSLTIVMQKMETEIEIDLKKVEVELEHEMQALNLEIEKKMKELELEMERK
ncbi:MAG: hypothetical protein JXR31_11685 [Prolixibacteraceae bacterium]|nr:hypothetical protein [Prolixibacteraceae bacterium]